MKDLDAKTAALHDIACTEGRDWYEDPSTGYFVFTKIYHERRG